VFLPIKEETVTVTSGKPTPVSGQDTPTISDWQQAEVKPVAKGQKKRCSSVFGGGACSCAAANAI
jgi:hypothetical protein